MVALRGRRGPSRDYSVEIQVRSVHGIHSQIECASCHMLVLFRAHTETPFSLSHTLTHTRLNIFVHSYGKKRETKRVKLLSLSLSLCLFSRTHRTKQRDMYTYKSRTMSAHERKLNTISLSSHIHTTYSHTPSSFIHTQYAHTNTSHALHTLVSNFVNISSAPPKNSHTTSPAVHSVTELPLY